MSSVYGENLKLSLFGQSHGLAIGMTLDGIPAGLPVDLDQLQHFLNRRAPGSTNYSTARRESDIPEFLSGLVDSHTCGAPIAAVIYNQNARTGDYNDLQDIPRPGHADYPAQIKFGGYQDASGGGHFSGRLTAPLCIAGGLCKQWLSLRGIHITAHILSISDVEDEAFDPVNPQFQNLSDAFPVLNHYQGECMKNAILEAKNAGDSVGGIIECAITGLPVGLGDGIFGGMESRISQIVYGIPSVKGISFGLGFGSTYLRGSKNNDPYIIDGGIVKTVTNNAGGILGGITTGMPIIFHTAIKPTSSISLPQQSFSLGNMEITTLEISGRHDPCIVPRAVPVVEAAAAIAIFDAILA